MQLASSQACWYSSSVYLLSAVHISGVPIHVRFQASSERLIMRAINEQEAMRHVSLGRLTGDVSSNALW